SHRNLVFNCRAVLESFTLEPNDLRLSWLPLSHSFARTSDYYLWIAGGGAPHVGRDLVPGVRVDLLSALDVQGGLGSVGRHAVMEHRNERFGRVGVNHGCLSGW
ncbi:MAG TPA: hypothetical protein VL175_20755, partial [Pirellulales bacterium]|nr:hypothetical protein [Pirellulales bacterium]